MAVKANLTHECVMAADDPHFRLRLPSELKTLIERSAKTNNRSINAEITSTLEEAYRPDGRYNLMSKLYENSVLLSTAERRLDNRTRLVADMFAATVLELSAVDGAQTAAAKMARAWLRLSGPGHGLLDRLEALRLLAEAEEVDAGSGSELK